MSKDLRLGILGNSKTSKKYQNFMELLSHVYSYSQNEICLSTSKNFQKKQKLNFAIVHYFTWKHEELASNVLWMLVGVLTWIWMASYQLQLVLGRFWLIVDGFGCLQMVLGGFRWFSEICSFSSCGKIRCFKFKRSRQLWEVFVLSSNNDAKVPFKEMTNFLGNSKSFT